MVTKLTRRRFHSLAGTLAFSGTASRLLLNRERDVIGAPLSAESQDSTSGITGTSRGNSRLMVPGNTPVGQTWRYGLTIPFQVAQKKAAAFCNIRAEYPPAGDYEVGTDVILFDSLSKISVSDAIPVSRYHEEPNPKSNPPGKRALMLKYPIRGGFIPFGAKETNGSFHPHAGTGFGMIRVLAWPIYTRAQVQQATDNLAPYVGPEFYEYFELQQYRYDGRTFQAIKTERVFDHQLLPGWTFSGFGLTNAIPDGNDLLFGMNGKNPHQGSTAGVARWKHNDKGWFMSSFTAVTGDDNSMEPSLIRDIDGSLLFSARGGKENTRNAIRVWRSQNGGTTWTQTVGVQGVNAGPITLNQAADGTPYIVSNLFQVFLYPLAAKWKVIVGEKLVPQGGWSRETLCLWPLNKKRTDLETPIVVRDSRKEFGHPPDGSTWMVDHPSGMTLQLADGDWHHILGYRVGTRGEMTNFGSDPAPQTGAYLEEVYSAGRPIAIWKF